MNRAFSRDPKAARSLKHSVQDGAAYSVMAGSGESYFSAFAVFLKASTAQIGFLASIPPLLGSFAQLFSAWLGHATGWRKRIIMIGVIGQLLVWIPLAVLPLLFPEHAVELMIGCVILFYALGNLAAPQWSSLMGELVAERRRGRYFAMRNRICSITSFSALVIGGLILHFFDQQGYTVWGYLLIFCIAFVARCISIYHLGKMYDPPGHVASMEMPLTRNWWNTIRRSHFARFSGSYAIIQFSVAVASPFFSVYMLRDLQFSYIEFMACLASTILMQFLTLYRWGRLSDVFGNRVILNLCGLLIPLTPLLWLVSENFWYLLCIQAFGGFIWAGFNLSAGNFLYDLIPATKRATYLAIHSVFASIGVFFGALLGGYLGVIAPSSFTLFGLSIELTSSLYYIFVLSFLLRLLSTAILLPRIKEIRKVKPIKLSRLFFRVGRFSGVSGLNFDIIASRKKIAPGNS